MAEDTKAKVQKDEPVTETQEAPMPSEEQKTTDVPAEAETQDGLPDEASDRTKHEFDKLNTQFREERQRREALEAAFSTLQPKQAAPAPIYDPDTGYIDPNVLTDVQRRAIEAEQRAANAERTVQEYRTEQEAKEAYTSYPELNPEDTKKFDKNLHIRVRSLILDSMVNPQDYDGKQLSMKDAADLLKNTASSQVEEARQEAAQQAVEQLTPKEQAALDAVGSQGNRTTEALANLDELRRRTRKGDSSATLERLAALKDQE